VASYGPDMSTTDVRRLSLIGVAASLLVIVPVGVAGAQDGSTESTITAPAPPPLNPTQLDADGFRVFTAYTNASLEVIHCRDVSCTDASRTFPDPDDEVTGRFGSSLVLDANGFPVISYYGIRTADLRIMHCNDPDCAGNDESITTPILEGVTGQYSDLVLDASGNPVVAYYDTTRGRLGLLVCDDPNCEGDETPVFPDPDRVTGRFGKSVALSAAGHPVVTYWDVTNQRWKLLQCGTPACAGPVRIIELGDYPPTDYPPASIVPSTQFSPDTQLELPTTGQRSPFSAAVPAGMLLAGLVLVGATRRAPHHR